MEVTLKFKHCQYDSVPLNDIDTTYSFFTESDWDDESVTKMHEDTAVRWLMSNPHFRQMFLQDFFDSAAAVRDFIGLQRPFTESGKHPGDIDLLLVDPVRPKFAVAFECKRVKALSSDDRSNVNSAKKIRHGVMQANSYRELGFHQTYLMIILLDDGRAMKTPNTMFRCGTGNTIDYIYSIPKQEPLHEEVGVIFVKVNQPTGKHINLTGGIGFCIDKKAGRQDQSHHVNTGINMILAKK